MLEEGRAELVARAFLGGLGAAEADECLPARLAGRHAGQQVLLRLAIEVKADLLVEAVLEAAAPGQGTQPLPGGDESAHHAFALLTSVAPFD
jgi:hypothetical protein